MTGIKPNRMVMQAAIREAESNRTPFGAVLAMGDQVFAIAASQPGEMGDSSTHPAIKVIRKLRDHTHKDDLSGFTLYSTCKPCSTCMRSVLESGIQSVIYGSAGNEISNLSDKGSLRNLTFVKDVSGETDIQGGFMKSECIELLDKYL